MFGKLNSRQVGVIEDLRTVPMFAGLSDEALLHLDAGMTELTLDAGTALTRENDYGREAFIILSGVAEVRVDDEVVGSVSTGDLVGEVSLLDSGPRTATVVAQTPLRVYVLDPRQFTALFDDPRAARWIAAALARRLRAVDTHQPRLATAS